MPKLRATPQEVREQALLKAIARSSVELGLMSDSAIAGYLGIGQTTFSARKRSKFRRTAFEDVLFMCQRLKFTPDEVCAIFGIKLEGGAA